MKSKSAPTLALAALAVLALALAAPASGQILFDAQLTGASEVPPVATTAFGSCTGVLTGFPEAAGPGPFDPSFHITCEHNVVDASLAHIHLGFPGQENPPTFNLGDPDDIDETWDLTVDQAIRLLAGGYYVNVHSPTFPDGEVRGQLEARQTAPAGVETLVFSLSGDQLVPGVTTQATGVCIATFEIEGDALQQGTLDLRCTHDVVDASDAVLIRGERDEAGEVIELLGDATSPILLDDVTLDFDAAAALRSGELALVIRSAANPGGEIRGQLTGCFGSATVLCLENGRFAVEVDWQTVRDDETFSGEGVAVQETDNTGMFWFFEPSNLEIMIKVLDACVDPFDRFWVFFAGLTDVGFDLRVTDTATGQTNHYSHEDHTVVTPVLDTDAFDTCDAP